MNDASSLGTILSVWAHPDDETYLAGGLMAAAVRGGSRVVCVTATRGELGSSDEERWPSGAALARLRSDELDKALAVLGISEHRWLDYPDGGCAAVDPAAATSRVRALVEEIRPDTVLTFGPDGMTGHPDHRAVGAWTTAALDGSGATLHYATHTPQWHAEFGPTFTELGAYMDDSEPVSTPISDASLYVRLTGAELDAKLSSMRCQESQIEPLIAATSPEFFRGAIAEEAFRPA